MKWLTAILQGTLIALLLTACGGGGSKNSAKGQPSVTVSVTPTILNVTADAGTSQSPTGVITLTFSSLPTAGLFVRSSSTNPVVRDMQLQQTGDTTAQLVVVLEDPAVLGPGKYDGVVEIDVCLDDQCAKPVSVGPRRVDLHYTVTGVPAPKPMLTVSPSMLEVESLFFTKSGVTATFDYTLANASNSSVNVSATSTGNGVSNVFVTNYSSTGGTFTVFFKTPRDLGTGVYNDTITVQATCNCPRGIDGAPTAIAVQYTVTDTIPGSEGLSVRLLPLKVNDLVWSQTQQKIYATVSSDVPVYGNTVVQIDPLTAGVETSSFVGSEPGVLAVSDDGQYVYVGLSGANAIRRKKLSDLSQDLLIQLGSDSNAGGLLANDIQVAPGLPHTIAVARNRANFSDSAGVAIFDDDVARVHTDGGFGSQAEINYIQWGADTSRLYGNTSENSSFAVSTLDVDASGARIVDTKYNVGSAYNFGRNHYANGILYSDGGQAYDPTSRSVLGTYNPAQFDFSRGIVPDPDHNKVFMVADGVSGIELRSFNLTTFTPIKIVPMNLPIEFNRPLRLIRWGSDGLAFATSDGRIALVNGPFVSSIAH